MPCGWEGGNHRSDSVRHRLQWFIHLRVHGLRKGDEHLAYTPDWVWYSFTFTPWMAPSSSGGFAIRCVLPVFWMTSFTHIILKALNRRQHGFDIAGCTQTDPPGAAPNRERSVISAIVLLIKFNVDQCALMSHISVRCRQLFHSCDLSAFSVRCRRHFFPCYYPL